MAANTLRKKVYPKLTKITPSAQGKKQIEQPPQQSQEHKQLEENEFYEEIVAHWRGRDLMRHFALDAMALSRRRMNKMSNSKPFHPRFF